MFHLSSNIFIDFPFFDIEVSLFSRNSNFAKESMSALFKDLLCSTGTRQFGTAHIFE